MNGIIPLFPGVPGGPELLAILLLAVLLFGANKIPKLARSSGQAIGEFQKGRQQVEDELEEMKQDDSEEEGFNPDDEFNPGTTEPSTEATVESETEPETAAETEPTDGTNT